MTTPAEREAERIRAEYERREREIGREFYSPTRPANLFLRQGQQRALLDALSRADLLPLGSRSILEIGCGLGRWLTAFEEFGAARDKLSGIDLDEGRILEARTRFQGADLRVGDATQLPWPDTSFDIVFQSLVFTSILDHHVREQVAAEMRRVLRPDGAVLWYDFRYDNPANASVRGVRAAEIAKLFPGWTIDLQRVSLAPPLARRIVGRSWLVASALERLRVLNTHYFGVIRPRRSAG